MVEQVTLCLTGEEENLRIDLMQVCNWKKQRNGHPDCTLTSLQEYYRCIYQPWFKMHGVDNDQGVHSSIPLHTCMY